MLSSFVSNTFCLCFGLLVPCYQTFKALKFDDSEAYKSLLKNWLLFGLFFAVYFFLDYIISWIPLYYECKFVVMFWLVYPQYRNATAIYTNFLHPLLETYEPHIDSLLASGKQRVKEHILLFKVYLLEFIRQTLLLFFARNFGQSLRAIEMIFPPQPTSEHPVESFSRPTQYQFVSTIEKSSLPPDVAFSTQDTAIPTQSADSPKKTNISNKERLYEVATVPESHKETSTDLIAHKNQNNSERRNATKCTNVENKNKRQKAVKLLPKRKNLL